MGAYLGKKLHAWSESSLDRGSARIGLFWAVDWLRIRETKMPFNVGGG